jgi:L-arabinokinase
VSVAFCISGHGFGHASRQVEVINALGALCPAVPIAVYTVASRWLLDRTIRVPVTLHAIACDTGGVQHDSLELDIPATLAAADAFEREADARADDLAARLRAASTRVVVCDVPAMPCTAAERAGAPAVALSNFTWDWIYDDFTVDHPGYDDLPARVQAHYARAHAGWRLPMGGGFDGFRTVLDMPWIARRSTRDPRDTRRLLGLADDTRPLVLLSFGGYGVSGWRLMHHAAAPYRLVIAGGASHEPTALPSDALQIARDDLQARGLRYEDLVAACDVVVSKPGYGIVSECVANGTALLYTDRGRFREYDVMVAEMPELLRTRFITQQTLASARWDDDIAELLSQPQPSARPLVNGADVAAGMISAML